MNHVQKSWLVAYDIRDPAALRRVHRRLRKEGLAAQYSVFVVEASDDQIERLLGELRTLIDQRADDLRAYHLPVSCTVWSLGIQHWPDGICMSGAHAARLLMDGGQVVEVEGDPMHLEPAGGGSA